MHGHPATQPRLDPRFELRALRLERDALREKLAIAEAEYADDLDATRDALEQQLLALRADIANLRRHRDEAIARARAEARAEGIAALASVHDDLIRALTLADDAPEAWLAGTRSVLAGVRRQLEALGAELVGVVGERFDPAVHEAVGQVPGAEDGRVAAVQQVGFRADGRLLRAARVVVTRTVEGI